MITELINDAKFMFNIRRKLMKRQKDLDQLAPKKGEMAPDFALKDLSGNTFSLSSTRGKVVILDFWATWCPPCRKEIPHFVDLYKDYRAKGLEVIGVSLDRGATEAVKRLAEKYGINFPILMGNQQVVPDY